MIYFANQPPQSVEDLTLMDTAQAELHTIARLGADFTDDVVSFGEHLGLTVLAGHPEVDSKFIEETFDKFTAGLEWEDGISPDITGAEVREMLLNTIKKSIHKERELQEITV